MLEIEVKVALDDDAEDRLLKGAEFINESKNSDTYFDTLDYSLTTKDRWLRKRNGKFELKIPYDENEKISDREVDRYHELEDEKEIRKTLNLKGSDSLENDLVDSGFMSFAAINTTRRNYKNEGLNIVIDEMDYGYKLAEIEIVVDDKDKAEEAKNKIINFAKERNLKYTSKGIGKVIEYLGRYKPEHIKALIESGTVEKDSLLAD